MTTLHDIVMGPARPDRPCGGCVACCQVLNVDEPEILKPAGSLCMHCTGAGCGIHETRPSICREWDCLWRRIDSMPAQTRPDRLRVVFTMDRQAAPQTLFDRLYFVGRAIDSGAALEGPMIPDILAMLAHGPLPIFVCWGEQRMMVYPRAELARAILDPEASADAALAEEARQWTARYRPFAEAADQVGRAPAA